MFGRKKRQDADAAPGAQDAALEDASTDSTTGDDDAAPEAVGPRDVSDVDGLGNRIDLGALQVAPVEGMELRLELDQQQQVTAAVIAVGDSLVQMQAFAAPRTSGIWDEIRDEIEEMITGRGGTVDVGRGPFGTELRTRLPQAGPEGRTVFAPAIFAGIDGTRWMLRAVYSGPAALDEAVRARLDEAIRGVVVVRGDEPRAPREMLPLSMPKTSRDGDAEGAPSEEPGSQSGDDLRPFERGPEITEVR